MLKGCRILLTIVVSCVVAVSSQGASRVERKSLEGLDSISVYVITQIDGEAIADTDLAQRIKTDIELKLRTLGIRVVPKPVGAALLAHIQMLTHTREGLGGGDPTGIYSVNVEFTLSQLVKLIRNDLPTYAITWSAEVLGYCQKYSLDDYARNMAKDKVDEFLNDYLEVNPPPTPPTEP